MAWWNNIISAVQNYFSPKPAVQSTVSNVQRSSPVSSAPRSTPGTYNTVSKSYNAPLKTSPSAPMSVPAARGVNVQGPTYIGSSGGGSNNVPSSAPSTPQPQGDISGTGATTSYIKEKAREFIQSPVQKLKAEAGKGITAAGNIVSDIFGRPIYAGGLTGKPGQPLGVPTTQEADRQILINALRRAEEIGDPNKMWLRDLPAYDIRWSRQAAGLSPSESTILQNLYEKLKSVSNAPSGATGKLPGAAKTAATGQILPSAAKTGAEVQPAGGVIPSPIPTPRGAVVPSKVETATLPANMQGLTAQNVNVPLAKAITPEAIQSIGQLLLTNLLGNQSTLTSLSPGIAQALWGAPTATSAFGGYEGSAPVPSQTSISQPKNLPPLPAVLNQG